MTQRFYGELCYQVGVIACVTIDSATILLLTGKMWKLLLECKAKGHIFLGLKMWFPQSFKGQLWCCLLHSNCKPCTNRLPPFLGFGGAAIGKRLLANRWQMKKMHAPSFPVSFFSFFLLNFKTCSLFCCESGTVCKDTGQNCILLYSAW